MNGNDEILGLLKDIAAILPTLATKKDLERFATKDDLASLEKHVTSELQAMRTDIAVLGGRLDEQRHVLAALIPRTVAAVPRTGAGAGSGD